MEAKYKEYLAATVLNDERIVTYRSLSRALKIHVNDAKEMLYEFHWQESQKKPGSIHATFLLTGIQQTTESLTANGDSTKISQVDYVQSSPFMSSLPNQDAAYESQPVRTVMLAREHDLEKAKALYDRLTSIHVYSLEPSSVKNLDVLEDCNREILTKYSHEDALEVAKAHGTIENPNVKRRSKRRMPPSSARPDDLGNASKAEKKPSTAAKVKDQPTGVSDLGNSSASAAVAGNDLPQSKNGAKKPMPLKRAGSDFFKSFTKPKSTLKKEDTESSAGASPAITAVDSARQSELEDEPMKDASEEEEEGLFLDAPLKPEKRVSERKSKAEEVQAALNKMMEDDDVPMDDSPEIQTKDSQEADVTGGGESQKIELVGVPGSSSTSGRRRGRRKVMKKKTVKDDEGYLVTREEAVWESFSEAEPEPPKPKTPASTASSVGGGKAKKSTSKPGQGNIASFFTKK